MTIYNPIQRMLKTITFFAAPGNTTIYSDIVDCVSPCRNTGIFRYNSTLNDIKKHLFRNLQN